MQPPCTIPSVNVTPSLHRAPGAGAPPRRPWLPVVLAWAAGGLVVLVVAAWAALTVMFPPDKVRALVSEQLSAALAREVRFTHAALGLWPPVRLSVREPALAEPGGFAHGAALQARALHLDLDILPLLGRHLVVRRLVLDRPQIHLVLLEDGTTNLEGMMKPKPSGAARASGGAMSLAIRDLRVEGARVLVDDLKAARRVAFGVESRVALSAEADGARFGTTGETRVTDLAFGPLTAARLSDLNRSLARLEWRLGHDAKFDAAQKRLALGRLALGLGRAQLAVSGVVDDPGPRARLDLHALGAGVDLGAILGYLAAADAQAVHGVSGGGRLDFDLRAAGTLGQPTPPSLTGTLTIADGSLHYPGAPAGVTGLACAARFAPDSLLIGDLRARIADQPVRAALQVAHFADPVARFALQGDLDLASIAPLVAPADTKLGGRVAVDVRGSGRAKDPGSLALEGGAKLKDVAVQSPALPQRVEGIRGDIRFTPAHASVTGFQARAGKSSFALGATVTRPLALMAPVSGPKHVAPAGVEFKLDSPYLDLAELLPVTPGAPVLPNATGGGTVHIARLKHQKLDVSDVAARVGLEPGVLTVPDFSLKAYGGSSRGNARFDLREPAKPVFALKSRVDSLNADALLSAWTPAKNFLHGSLTTDLDLSGAGLTLNDLKRTITAVGMAAVARGTLGPGPALEAVARLTKMPALKELHFKDGHVPFRVENGRVVTDPVVLDGEHGQWKLAGAVGFDGSLDYAVSATLPPEVASRLGAASALAAGALSDGQGRMLLDLHLGGSVTAPQVGWDTRAMRDRLAGKASQALSEQRSRLESEARNAVGAHLGLAPDSSGAGIGRANPVTLDSLKRRAGGLLKGLFGGGGRDTTPP